VAIDEEAFREGMSLVERGVALLRLAVQQDDESEPEPLPAPIGRVETIGKVAHLHLQHLEEHGTLLQADSIRIRRRLYGDKVRATANLFGRKDSGAILYRGVPYGQRVKSSDPIRLTDEGMRLAAAYRRLHAG
jgi:hypothetical protein